MYANFYLFVCLCCISILHLHSIVGFLIFLKPNGFYSVSKKILKSELLKEDATQREVCLPCPIGANCIRNNMVLEELTAKPGYWRTKVTSQIFPACSEGHRGLDADIKALASKRCKFKKKKRKKKKKEEEKKKKSKKKKMNSKRFEKFCNYCIGMLL